MNKGIKFRIRGGVNDKFFYWGFIDGGFISPTVQTDGVSFSEIQKRSEQFTGKVDINGVEIYAGDKVVGYTFVENDNDAREWTVENPAIVVWIEEYSGFYPFIFNARWRCEVMNITVIGNIWENQNNVNEK